MILAFGETLIDIFPSYSRVGGAPLNFITHITGLGESAALISRIGTDSEGRQIEKFFADYSLDSGYLQKDSKHETGKVFVTPASSGPEHGFEIAENAAYDWIEYPRLEQDAAENTGCFYFGTLSQRTENGRAVAEKLLELFSGKALLFYDINLRPGCFTEETVKKSLYACDVLKANNEELEYLKKISGITARSDNDAVLGLMEKYTVETAAITYGAEGAKIFSRDSVVQGKSGRRIMVRDTVGAGDSFAAVLAKGLLCGMPHDEILEKALDISARVCGIAGAVPEAGDKGFYESGR